MTKAWVVDRGTSRLYEGLRLRRIQLPDGCIHCGGPRGALRVHRFAEDGEWYDCHTWNNICGHIERYQDLLSAADRAERESQKGIR